MIKRFLIIGALGLAACGDEPQTVVTDVASPVTEGRIVTEAQFQATVADKTLTVVDEAGEPVGGVFVIARDGTWSGTAANGNVLGGTWDWNDGGYWCREITSGVTGAPPEDCQLMEVDPNGLAKVTRDRGNGNTFFYAVSS